MNADLNRNLSTPNFIDGCHNYPTFSTKRRGSSDSVLMTQNQESQEKEIIFPQSKGKEKEVLPLEQNKFHIIQKTPNQTALERLEELEKGLIGYLLNPSHQNSTDIKILLESYTGETIAAKSEYSFEKVGFSEEVSRKISKTAKVDAVALRILGRCETMKKFEECPIPIEKWMSLVIKFHQPDEAAKMIGSYKMGYSGVDLEEAMQYEEDLKALIHLINEERKAKNEELLILEDFDKNLLINLVNLLNEFFKIKLKSHYNFELIFLSALRLIEWKMIQKTREFSKNGPDDTLNQIKVYANIANQMIFRENKIITLNFFQQLIYEKLIKETKIRIQQLVEITQEAVNTQKEYNFPPQGGATFIKNLRKYLKK